jgi:hypothetical protein
MTLIERVAQACGILLLMAGLSACGDAQTVTTGKAGQFVTSGMRPLPVHVGGRTQKEGGDHLYRWPGIYFEGAFNGPALVVKLADPGIEYRLLVDDRPPVAIIDPQDAEIRIDGLTAGPHRVRLEKVSEGERVPGRFGGFFIGPEAAPLPAPRRRRQIEFIGDSSMTGFGLRSPGPDCASGEAQTYADTQAAYPALIARRMDADYQINAITGRGLIRNYGMRAPDKTIGRLYPYTLRDEPPVYRQADWRPQLYVISLLADFVTAPRPGEPWTTMDQVADAYIAAFGRLAADLHRRSPQAAMAVGWPALATVTGIPARQMLEKVRDGTLAAARKAGFSRVGNYVVDVRGLARTGCGRHYSAADQRKLAGDIHDALGAQGLLPRR